MQKITVKISDDNGTAAPLFEHFDGQCQPQPAYLELDPPEKDEPIILSAEYDGNIGGGMPVNVWEGEVYRLEVHACVLRSALEGLPEDKHFTTMVTELVAEHNKDERDSEATQELERNIEGYLSDLDLASVANVEEWWSSALTTLDSTAVRIDVDGCHTITSTTPDKDLAGLAGAMKVYQDGSMEPDWVVIGEESDILEYLIELRDDLEEAA